MIGTVFHSDEHMAICAVRYCLGRRTYIVGDCCRWLKQVWPNLSDEVRQQIATDIECEFDADDAARKRGSDYKPLGMDMDRAEWESVRYLWQKPKGAA